LSRNYDVKASKTFSDQPNVSWSVPQSEVVELDRKGRSSKPQITYQFGAIKKNKP